MASEAEASCESDPNFAIICAFLEKFGELCGIGSIDFVELQSMLENNQEVSPELMNLHIKLLRKTKKNVTVERWERALVNMCHKYSSKDAWEIERFGYKKTRLQVKLRALKELLEMQFDYHTKFKNEVNKMSAESLRPQPLGRDKLGRAYWFQTDNNYQIRIYKEDPDEETWHLVAKDRDGLVSLMNELADGDSKLSSDSALNEDSNSLSEKPFIDTGQSENSNESKKVDKNTEKSEDASNDNSESEKEVTMPVSEESAEVDSKSDEIVASTLKDETTQKTDDAISDEEGEETDEMTEKEEVQRPMLRIKSLSELMEKPKETNKSNVLQDLPELTIIKKPKLDTSQITITRIPKGPQLPKDVEVSPEIQSPVMIIKGNGSGSDNESFNVIPKKNEEEVVVSEVIEEEVMVITGEGYGMDCETGNEKRSVHESNKTNNIIKNSTIKKPVEVSLDSFNMHKEDVIVSEAIEEEVMFVFGEGSGRDCDTGNEKEKTATQEIDQSKTADSKLNIIENPHKVPIDSTNLDTIIDSKTDTGPDTEKNDESTEGSFSPKKAQFFFGPGSLNTKPTPVSPGIHASSSEETPQGTEELEKSNGSVSAEKSEEEENSEVAAQNTEEDTSEKVQVPLLESSKFEESTVGDDLPNENIEEKIEEVSQKVDDSIEGKPDETENKEKKEIEDESKAEELDEETVGNIESSETNKSSTEEENESSKKESSELEDSSEKSDQKTQEKLDTSEKSKENITENKKEEENGTDLPETEENLNQDEKVVENSDKNDVDKEKIEDEEGSDKKEEDKEEDEDNNENPVEESVNEKSESECAETNEDVKSEDHQAQLEKSPENITSNDSNQIDDDEKSKEKGESEPSTLEEEEGEEVEEEIDTSEPHKDEEKEDKLTIPAASKRKRTTRNTSALDESITEEDMNPRKKAPVEKTKNKRPQKVTKAKTPEQESDEKVESSSTVGETRTTRQTRQTRSAAVEIKEQEPTAVPAKAKGKLKKANSKTSKSDEADSPAPLESVTIVDTDNSNTTAENPEKDPLAVSEEETNQAVPSITSFSFDYNPDSPAPTESKRSLRKRGRENFDDKPEASEKKLKIPKMRGKRTVDQTLRKSVEEKRQQVGDGSSDENELVKVDTKAKGTKKGPVKKKVETPSVSDSDNASQKSVKRGRKGASGKNKRILKNLGVKEEEMSSIAESPAPVRQSRRLAQIKIKEDATRRRVDEDDVSITKKKKKSDDKDFKVGKRKRIEEEVKPAPTPPLVEKKKKKKNKQNKISIGWKSSSEDSDNSCQEEEEVSEYEEHHEEEPLQFKSDHEFSPESDLECDEPLPLKRARTVRKEESDDDEELEEEFPCQKCGKSDHPEWILLCDKCDNGWHCSCLRPPLFVIPEGDWYCPSCQHESLIENLSKKLIEFDKSMVKKEMEDRRKERLAYVGISLNNVLPAKEKKDKKSHKSSESEGTSRENTPSGSESEASDSDEPIYQLRQRRQAHSYKFQDYDDLINSALDEEPPADVEKTHTVGRGKDIATIVNAAKEEEEKNGFEDLPPVVPRDPEESRKKAMSYRKKPKRLNNLEVNSDDEADDSDEDFKGSSSAESDEEEYTEDSDDSFVGRKSSRPVRRSTRARTTRFDADFINDDSEEAPSRKKKKKYFSDSESSLSDDWRGKKSNKGSKHKKSKKKKMFDDSDLENYRKKKPKIKYGMDSEDDAKGRRTRGKKTSYLDTLGSDSEEETLKKKIKDKSDDEYVAEDDEEKESEEEIPDVDKSSDEEDEDRKKHKKQRSDDSDSEDQELVKRVNPKTKRAIMDSEDEEEEEEEEEEKVEKKKESPKLVDKNRIINEELAKTVKEFEEQVPVESKTVPDAQTKELANPAVVPGLNVEKLKACGITVTKVAKDKAGIPPQSEEAPSNLIEIGAKPIIPASHQKSITPSNLAKIEKSLDELDEEEVEEMMESEEYANRQLQLAAIQIREAKRLKELEKKEIPRLPPTILRKPVEMFPKKQGSGRFFNMKPPQESMLGNSSLVMNDDDNDELSEPPGVTLPMFSELGSIKVHNLSKSNNSSRNPMNNTPPPPSSPNRAVPVPFHNMPMGGPHSLPGSIPMVPPNSFGPPRPTGMMHQMRPNRPMGPRGAHIPPMMGPRGPMPPMDPSNLMMRANMPGIIPNVPRNMSVPPMGPNIKMGTSASVPISSNAPVMTNPQMSSMSSVATSVPVGLNMSMASNMPMGPIAHAGSSPNVNVGSGGPGPRTNPSPVNDSPDGTPKKRRGRGKGKKTLAAEAAAAAAAAGGLPEPNKTVGNKPPVANIEIASPPQPFSQSQPAPSVITRMLQTAPGKGAFPVGRIRPKQFAMMQDSDDNDSPRSAESQEKDVSVHPAPTAPPSHPPVPASHGSHPAGHYGPPPGQYPPNFYQKEAQPQPPHGFHHQRPPPPQMHPYPPHPSQPPMDPPPMNAPIHQPPIGMADPPALGPYSAPPPPSKSPYEGMPPHRPPYPNANPGYNYDYVPPPVMADEGVPPPYENPTAYPEQYEAGPTNLDPSSKSIEEEPSGEFGGLVSYFSSQHDDELEH